MLRCTGWRSKGGVSALYSHHGACSPVARGGAKMVTDPPAPSTAAMADLEAPHTENATLLLIVPEPSRRTPPFGLRSTPAFTSASTSTVPPASSLPASIAA